MVRMGSGAALPTHRVRQRRDEWGTRFRCWLRSVGEVGVGGGEGCEVVRAENVAGRLVEGGQIQGPGTGPDIGCKSGRTDEIRFEVQGSRFEREDAVLIGFAEGGVARVKVWRNDFGGEDADAGRKTAVEGAMQGGGGDGRGEGKLATWARAWTPASVRPEPWGRTRSPTVRWMASERRPWTVGRLG